MPKDDCVVCVLIEESAAALERWTQMHGASEEVESLHQHADPTDCAYWRAGYLKALQDILSLIASREEPGKKFGTYSLFH
ncbi:MAG: hypothetical protein H8K04_07780 [Nitrospira sp.]